MKHSIQDLIASIEQAFASVRLEEGISLHEAIVVDDYGTKEERAAARALDEHNDWSSISDDLIAQNADSLAFLDAKGLRYYLPAFMRFTLRHYKESGSSSTDFTIYTLTPNATAHGFPRLELLSKDQKKVTRQFLERMAHQTEDEEHSRAAREALKTIWWRGRWFLFNS